MCKFTLFSPEGQQCPITIPKQHLQKMTPRDFTAELVKQIAKLSACSEYTKDNIRLIVRDKHLDDYENAYRTAAEMLTEVNGPTVMRRVDGGPTAVQRLRRVNAEFEELDTHRLTLVQRLRKVNAEFEELDTHRLTLVQRLRKVNAGLEELDTDVPTAVQAVRKVNGG